MLPFSLSPSLPLGQRVAYTQLKNLLSAALGLLLLALAPVQAQNLVRTLNHTYKGEVAMTNFGGTLRLDTFMGKAQVAFSPLARDSRIESHEGQVAVALPDGVGFDLDVDLGTAQAIFVSEASFAGLDPPDGANGSPMLAGKKTTYRASINGGGARLSLTTHSGSVRLSKVENGK